MSTKDSRIDAYIAKSAEFARPILKYLRGIIHAACPEVEETIKWSAPHFMHRGMLCGLVAFKQHCRFIFWKGDLIFGGSASEERRDNHPLRRITTLSDLPGRAVLLGYVRKAVELNEAGIKAPRPQSARKKELVVPADLKAALKKNKKALTTFQNFSYSHRKEYVEWITGARRPETRMKRLTTAIAWLSAGKSRHWKYAGC